MKKHQVCISTLILLTLAPLGLAQTSKETCPITVEDMWAVKRVGTPSLSPDGRWAAVEVTSYDMKENNSTSDIDSLRAIGQPV